MTPFLFDGIVLYVYAGVYMFCFCLHTFKTTEFEDDGITFGHFDSATLVASFIISAIWPISLVQLVILNKLYAVVTPAKHHYLG